MNVQYLSRRLGTRSTMEGSPEPSLSNDGHMEPVAEITLNSSWSWLPLDIAQILYIVVILSFLYVVLKGIQLYRWNRYLVKGLSCFPGPPTHWLYGHIKMIKPEEELQYATEMTKTYPYCYPLWYGRFLAFLSINHPEYAKAVISRNDPKASICYKFIIPWIGKGLLTLNGPKWQQHRRLLTPGFHFDVLKSYVTPMADSVKEMLDVLETLVPKHTTVSLEMFEHVTLMTFDTIMKCAFSYQGNCQTDRNAYINTVFDISCMIMQRLRIPLYYSDLIYWFSYQGYQFRKACKLAQQHTDNVIRERKKYLKNEKEFEKILKKRHLDFLDILLCAKDENGNPLSDEDIRAEVDTFMFEGHDSTASGISWLLYCMAQNPEHQRRCREEIKEILGDREVIQWDDLGKMTYTTLCIKESLRLYPPVPMIARELDSPVTFAEAQNLPKGVLVLLNIYSLHRNPLVWDDPEVFNPLRFSTENLIHRHPYAFLPFAAGQRNCIGQQFAMNVMKIALALTLLRFELLPDPSKRPIPVAQIVTRSKNGIHLKLKNVC